MKTKLFLLGALLASVASATDFVWIEGETVLNTNGKQNPWMKGDNPKLLSGGDAFGVLAKPSDLPIGAIWKITVPADGLYHFYMRNGYPDHNPETRIRFVKLGPDGKPVSRPGPEEGWIDLDIYNTDAIDQRSIGQHRSINWQRFAPIELAAGDFIFELQGKKKDTDPVWMVYDAFVLTTEPFIPSGTTKPGETLSPDGAGAAGSLY